MDEKTVSAITGFLAGVVTTGITSWALYSRNKVNRDKNTKSAGLSATNVKGLKVRNLKIAGYDEGALIDDSQEVDIEDYNAFKNNQAELLVKKGFFMHCKTTGVVPSEKKFYCDELEKIIESLEQNIPNSYK